MKVLRMPAYFYPELTSSTHLQLDRLEGFAREGITVTIHTPTPTRGLSNDEYSRFKNNKSETMYNGLVEVYRFRMYQEGHNPIFRAFRYVLTNLIQYHKGIHEEDIDVIYGSSTPPTQGMLCGMVAKKLSKKYKKKVPFVFNLQDVFPDSLVTTGMTHKGSLIWKIGRKIEDFTYRNADQIIVISESMKRNILEKGVPGDKITVVPNWIDTEAVQPVPKEKNELYEEFHIDSEKFTVLYAGNFGAAQGADVILKAAELLKKNSDIQFVIFGGGAEFSAAKQYVQEHQLDNVIIHDLLPQDRVSEVYSLGDVALITCKKGVGTSGMPSKTWSIMACNTPIIAAFDMDSELHNILEDSGAGICVPAEDVEALGSAIKDACETSKIPSNTVNSRQYVQEHASKNICVSQYIKVLRETMKNGLEGGAQKIGL